VPEETSRKAEAEQGEHHGLCPKEVRRGYPGGSMKKSKKVFGRGANQCKRCSRKSGLVRKYGIYLCRQCFREIAPEMGFEKYS